MNDFVIAASRRIKILSGLFFFLFAFYSGAQTKIDWPEKRRLTLSDFKGPVPDPAQKQNLVVRTGFENRVSVAELAGRKHVNEIISNVFFPDDSWISRTDPSRLRYFLTNFDINEWKARELRKRYFERMDHLTKEEINRIYSDIQQEFSLIHIQYETDTQTGENAQAQMNWEMKVSDKLLMLSDFCKSCTPKTKRN